MKSSKANCLQFLSCSTIPKWLSFKPVPLSLILTLTLVAGIGGIVVSVSLNSSSKKSTPLPTSLTQTQAIQNIAAAGRLQPEGDAIHLAAPSSLEFDKRVAELFVKEGDNVKPRQVIAVLDILNQRLAALETAKQQLKVAQERLNQVKAGAKTGEIAAQKAKIASLKAELTGEIKVNDATLARLEAQKNREIASAEAEVARIEAELSGELVAIDANISRLEFELSHAKTECQRYQQLHELGVESSSNYESKCLEAKTVQQEFYEAKANRQRTKNTLTQQITKAQANLNLARETLEQQINETKAQRQQTRDTFNQQIIEAQANLDKIAEIRPVDVATATAEVNESRAKVEQAQTDLEFAYIRSPIKGQILKIHAQPGEIISNQGIASLGQTEQMEVITEVYETDVSHIRIGQRATITSDALAGKIQGTVTKIGEQISKQSVFEADPMANVSARVVEVRVRLDKKDSQRVANFTNLQVKVIIHL
jgi:HlyD family secretion protein